VLRRQPVGERDYLLDVFSAHAGLTSVRVSPPTRIPDYFELYQGDWQAGREWPKLKACHPVESYQLSDNALVCAFYLAELLCGFLTSGEPAPELFSLFRNTLNALDTESPPEPWLRAFEVRLLAHSGYTVEWAVSAGQPVRSDCYYSFAAETGFVVVDDGVPGDILLAIDSGNLTWPGAMKVARQVLRAAIDNVMQRPLVSRELII